MRISNCEMAKKRREDDESDEAMRCDGKTLSTARKKSDTSNILYRIIFKIIVQDFF